MSIKIAPSILSADLGRLADELRAAEDGGVDWIHLDVMDGHFVPNITIGPLVAAAARNATALPLDAHLMITDPDRYIRAFADAGVDSVTVHAEVTPHLHRTVQTIRDCGVRAGVAINPSTSPEALREIIPYVDLVLVMSVNPGFGGQKFIEGTLGKIRRVRALLDSEGRGDAELQVDGGVTVDNIRAVAEAGATVVVAGFAVYNREAPVAENVARLRAAAGQADHSGTR
jgi:ribulose-phosphate 3-epimerase